MDAKECWQNVMDVKEMCIDGNNVGEVKKTY
jgi:hypothetical protein